MSGKKILIISQVFYPDEVAVANLFTNLASALVSSGLDVKVWCAQPSYTSSIRQPRKKLYEGININYLSSTNFRKEKMVGRILNFLTFTISAATKLLFSGEKEIVITHTTPPFTAIILSFICKAKKRKFLYILMDIFPDGLIRLNKVSPANVFIKLWQALHRKALKNCSDIVVIGRDMKDWLALFCPQASGKIKYIPLWQDEKLIGPTDFINNPFILKNDLQNQFIVQYSGNMGLWNEMKTIGKAIGENPDNTKFVIVGGGMRKKELLESINDSALSKILFLPFQPNEDYSVSVSACHVALVSLRDGLQGMAVPSKIIGIMAAGIPVIALAPVDSEIAYIIKEEDCGLRVDPSDSKGLVDAINILRSDERLRKRLGLNGRNAFLKKYTTEVIAEKYLDLIGN